MKTPQIERVFSGFIDRVKLAKILGILGSNQDGEVLSAARAAEEMRQRANLTWEDLLGVALGKLRDRDGAMSGSHLQH